MENYEKTELLLLLRDFSFVLIKEKNKAYETFSMTIFIIY